MPFDGMCRLAGQVDKHGYLQPDGSQACDDVELGKPPHLPYLQQLYASETDEPKSCDAVQTDGAREQLWWRINCQDGGPGRGHSGSDGSFCHPCRGQVVCEGSD